MNAWEEIKQSLAKRVRTEAFQNWVAQTTYKDLADGCLTVSVPTELTRDWMQTEYAGLVRSIIRDHDLPVSSIEYETVLRSEGGQPDTAAFGEVLAPTSNLQLNPKFTFDNFVVGSCNQFAHAAAKAVATNPSRSYNPLFIYGGVGHGQDAPDARHRPRR